MKRTTGNSNRQEVQKSQGRGSDAVAKTRHRNGQSEKRSGPVNTEDPTDPAPSSESAGLLTRFARNTQSLCVTSSGDEGT